MHSFRILAIIVATAPFTALATGVSAQQVMACYNAGSSPEEKYACMGSSVSACAQDSGASIAECADAETEVWRMIMDQQVAEINAILQD